MADQDPKDERPGVSDDAEDAAPKSVQPLSMQKAEVAKSHPPKSATTAGNGGNVVVAPAVAHADAGGHGAHDDHGLAHTTPVWLLFAILSALMVLTILTVSVTSIDLGAQGNLIVAMVIATVKAALVVSFFMHLVWDKKLHLILFLTSVLFLVLFLSLSVNDRGEYQQDIDSYINASQQGAR